MIQFIWFVIAVDQVAVTGRRVITQLILLEISILTFFLVFCALHISAPIFKLFALLSPFFSNHLASNTLVSFLYPSTYVVFQVHLLLILATTRPGCPGLHLMASPSDPRSMSPVSGFTLIRVTGYALGKITDRNPQAPTVLSGLTRLALPSVAP